MVRIAVIDKDLCKPKHCQLECIRFCPLVRAGKKAIEFPEGAKRPIINEHVCVGCGICVKKCPFNAIHIINLPDELEKECVHRYGPSGFKLYRLPAVREGTVLGLIGPNAIGKTTVLKILAGEIKPNLCDVECGEKSWDEIIRRFRGTEIQEYFRKMVSGEVKTVHKPQFIEVIPKFVKGKVGELLSKIDEKGMLDEVKKLLDLERIWDKDVRFLSGGELQKVAIAAALLRRGNVYLFDEPASHLDVRERVRVAKAIRRLAEKEGKAVVVVEHDLAILDYVSDIVCVLYGVPGAYGVVSHPKGVRTGINEYLDGFLKSENMRIRDEPIRFRLRPPERPSKKENVLVEWSDMRKEFPGFKLEVKAGFVRRGEVVGVLGPNGIGKSTFVKILAGVIKPDEGYVMPYKPDLKISYKPQYLVVPDDMKYLTVAEALKKAVPDYESKVVWRDLEKPLQLDRMMHRYLGELSGGELQRVFVAISLLRDADIYLLDEPLAYLDIEQRLTVAKVIRRIAEEVEVAILVVEHDIVMVDYMSDAIMVFTGEPAKHGIANPPTSLREGMNMFLKELGITFRRDLHSGRPRINKEGSRLDRLQKEVLKEYYYIPSGVEKEVEEEEAEEGGES